MWDEINKLLRGIFMSLHDVSKNDNRRAQPAPNQIDQLDQYKAAGTTQVHNAGEEALVDGLKILERQIIAKQDGVNKAVYGFDPSTGRFVLKVADDGVDVLTATDDQLVFNSAQDVFKIVATSTTTVPYGSGDTVQHVTIAHGLGYIPAVQVYLTSSPLGGDFYFPLPSSPYYARSGGFIVFNAYMYFTVDSTNLKIYVATGTTSGAYAGNWNFKYYLLQETAN